MKKQEFLEEVSAKKAAKKEAKKEAKTIKKARRLEFTNHTDHYDLYDLIKTDFPDVLEQEGHLRLEAVSSMLSHDKNYMHLVEKSSEILGFNILKDCMALTEVRGYWSGPGGQREEFPDLPYEVETMLEGNLQKTVFEVCVYGEDQYCGSGHISWNLNQGCGYVYFHDDGQDMETINLVRLRTQ